MFTEPRSVGPLSPQLQSDDPYLMFSIMFFDENYLILAFCMHASVHQFIHSGS